MRGRWPGWIGGARRGLGRLWVPTCLVWMASTMAARGLTFNRIAISNHKPQVFEMIEMTLDVQGAWSNPFDPQDVAIDVILICPDGQMLSVPAFYFVPFSKTLEGVKEILKQAGPPTWKARFTPRVIGRYFLRVEGRDRDGAVSSSEMRLEAVESRRGGFVRISPGPMPHFFLEPDESFFAVGENLCWAGAEGTFEYDRLYQKLAQSSANFVRVWMGPWGPFCLERHEEGRKDLGCGHYDMESAWRLDQVLQTGQDLGIYHMLTLDTFNSLRKQPPYEAWQLHPYSIKHGGPLSEPREFFFDPSARLLYKNRLRYIVGRWAAYTSLAVWELWNEVDLVDAFVAQDVASWHREMAGTLRTLDGYAHPITTSFAREEGVPEIDLLDGIDLVQTHAYARYDLLGTIFRASQAKRSSYDKPHWVGEYGTGYAGENTFKKDPWVVDPRGLCLKEGLWASLMSGDPGTALSWYWSDYVDRQGLYPLFGAVAAFVKGTELHRMDCQPVRCNSSWKGQPPIVLFKEIVPKVSEATWTPSEFNAPQQMTLDPSGVIKPKSTFPGILHGIRNHSDLHNPILLTADMAFPGKLIIDVQGVSGYGGAALFVQIDEKTVLDEPFLDPDDDAATETLHNYDGAHEVDVPEGLHKILIENTGPDWLFVGYRFTGEFTSTMERPTVLGIQSNDMIMAWASLPAANWYYTARGSTIRGDCQVLLSFSGIANGKWQVTWHDTNTGKALSEMGYLCSDGTLIVPSPAFPADIALKGVRVQ